MQSGDEAAADATFDRGELIKRATAGLSLTPDYLAAESRREMRVFSYIPTSKQNGTQFRLLRVRLNEGEWRALYRTMKPDSSFNYNEYIMVADANGQWRFADIYTMALGEMQSQLERKSLIASIAIKSGNLTGLSQYDRDCAANAAAPTKMSDDLQAGKYAQVLATYDALPQSMRESRMFLYFRIAASAQLLPKEPEPHLAAAAEFRRLFPDDPILDGVDLQRLIRAKDFQGISQSIDRLQRYIGGDPYLTFLKAHFKVAEGGDENLGEAASLYRKAIGDEPTLRPPYYEFIDLSLKTKNYDLTASILNDFQTQFHVNLHSLEELPELSDFRKSDAFRKWDNLQKQ